MTTASCAITRNAYTASRQSRDPWWRPDEWLKGGSRLSPGRRFWETGRAWKKSGLGLRQIDDQPLHLRRYDELAGEAAVGPPRAGGAFEHRVLVGLHRGGLRQLVFADIDMAGGAHAGAAALGDDAVDPVKHRGLHDAGAFRD